MIHYSGIVFIFEKVECFGGLSPCMLSKLYEYTDHIIKNTGCPLKCPVFLHFLWNGAEGPNLENLQGMGGITTNLGFLRKNEFAIFLNKEQLSGTYAVEV